MEGLEGLEALGNAAAVPVIIFLTQLIKKRIGNFKYGSDVLALGLSFVLCTGWTFYEMTPTEYATWAAYDGLHLFKWAIDRTLVGFATWLAASKIYDLGHGNKKRDTKSKEVLLKKKELEEKLLDLETSLQPVNVEPAKGDTHEEPVEETKDLSEQLREVLEGR